MEWSSEICILVCDGLNETLRGLPKNLIRRKGLQRLDADSSYNGHKS